MVGILAGVAFVTLFAVWVIVPTVLKKRHIGENELSEEE